MSIDFTIPTWVLILLPAVIGFCIDWILVWRWGGPSNIVDFGPPPLGTFGGVLLTIGLWIGSCFR